MDRLFRWIDSDVEKNLPLVLTLHGAIFVGLLLVGFLFLR